MQKKKLVDKLVKECTENIDEDEKCNFKCLQKFIQVLHSIHSIIGHYFYNNHRLIFIGT